MVAAVELAISMHRFTVRDEIPLQDALARLFAGMGLAFEREARLLQADRVDFLLEQGVAVEVKVRGTVADVTRQIWRYAGCERVTRLVLVTTQERHRSVVRLALGKPVRVVRAAWL